eukprot:792986_1
MCCRVSCAFNDIKSGPSDKQSRFEITSSFEFSRCRIKARGSSAEAGIGSHLCGRNDLRGWRQGDYRANQQPGGANHRSQPFTGQRGGQYGAPQQYGGQFGAQQTYGGQQYANQQYASRQYANPQYTNQQYANQQYTNQQYGGAQQQQQQYGQQYAQQQGAYPGRGGRGGQSNYSSQSYGAYAAGNSGPPATRYAAQGYANGCANHRSSVWISQRGGHQAMEDEFDLLLQA